MSQQYDSVGKNKVLDMQTRVSEFNPRDHCESRVLTSKIVV